YKGETYTIESEIVGVKYEEETPDVSPSETFIDYDYIEQYHEILFHNICDSPREDYSDTVLAEYLKEDIEKDKKLIEADSEEGRPLTIDYHLFDFNDDGLEDYLVCLRGTFWSKDDRNVIMIYIQEKDGTLQKIFEYYVHLHDGDMPRNHAPAAVLAERVENYHSLVLPGTNSLLRYDKEKKQYEFYEIENYAEEELTEDKMHRAMSEEEYEAKKEMYENIKHIDMSVYIDYEFIEAKHEILRHNICISPRNDYENTPLKEYLEDDVESDRQYIENTREMMEKEKISVIPLYIDYFSFDFNDDGLEDYLVCYHGGLWSGTGGNHVAIYIQESNGLLSEVFSITMRLHEYAWPNEHSPMAILDEKNDGYYAFVLVGNSHIVRYNKERGRYVF
ncbi:MAG: hypothetical protein K2H31_06890, partial [Lachnospiraceae bacterium]|nr:hypothetical protein [Lachnospiraceae bacterium]